MFMLTAEVKLVLLSGGKFYETATNYGKKANESTCICQTLKELGFGVEFCHYVSCVQEKIKLTLFRSKQAKPDI